jgi:hypothetical protein
MRKQTPKGYKIVIPTLLCCTCIMFSWFQQFSSFDNTEIFKYRASFIYFVKKILGQQEMIEVKLDNTIFT